MTLQAATALAENSEPVLVRIVEAIRSAGLVVEMVDDPADVDLLFACGLATIAGIDNGSGRTIIAAPHFPEETGPTYRSVVITREPSSLASVVEGRVAVNEYSSWSGWHGYREFLESQGLTANVDHQLTGTHLSSVDAVRSGAADVACIDATIWRELADHTGLHVVATTNDWPTPPVSVSPTVDLATIDAIRSIVTNLDNVSRADESQYTFMLSQLRR